MKGTRLRRDDREVLNRIHRFLTKVKGSLVQFERRGTTSVSCSDVIWSSFLLLVLNVLSDYFIISYNTSNFLSRWVPLSEGTKNENFIQVKGKIWQRREGTEGSVVSGGNLKFVNKHLNKLDREGEIERSRYCLSCRRYNKCWHGRPGSSGTWYY